MRRLAVTIAVTAAATLGFAGTAFADAHEETLCPPIDQVTQALVDGGLPLDDTQDGLVETCKTSNTTNGLAPSPLLCGLTKDLTEEVAPELGQLVDGVHGGIKTVEDQVLSNVPLPLLTVDHPCPDGDGGTTPTNTGSGGGAAGGGGGGAAPAVLGANATADGGLPRTGGELFAGAGFALMSLGALVRRFLP